MPALIFFGVSASVLFHVVVKKNRVEFSAQKKSLNIVQAQSAIIVGVECAFYY